MLVGGGHSGVTGVNGAGVASWWSHFKVVSAGHAGARGTWGEPEKGCEWSHPQTGMVCDEQETLDNGGYNVFRVAMGRPTGVVSGGIHRARSKHGGHRQRVTGI